MQNIIIRLSFFFLLLSFGKLYALNFKETDEIGRKILQSFVDKDFKSIEARVDSVYRNSYLSTTLEKDWAELTGTYGKYLNSRSVNFEKSPYYNFIAYKINFEYLPYLLNLSFNEKGKIIYLSFMEAHKVYYAQDYVDVSKFTDQKFSLIYKEFELQGLLSVPNQEGKVPLVVIIGEAGPTDKDGSYDENKPYKDLAWGMASKGYAVYRFDKRVISYGIYLLRDKNSYTPFTCREEYLEDIYNALDTLERLPFIDLNRIYVLGHGEGGILTPLVAKERKEVKGIILLGANSKRTQEMMIDQYAYLSTVSPNKKQEYDEQTQKAIRSMDKNLNPLTEHYKMPYEVQATYWIWLNKYKHLEMAKKQTKPILILHGNRDYQVNMENLKIWQKTLGDHSNVTIKSYPKLNHLFYPGEVASTYSEYFMKSNIPDYVLKDITDWLSTH